jgi:hypothetical protein
MTQDQALDLWKQFAEQLRYIRSTEGDIHRDDSRIWDGYLHVWTNEHWTLVLEQVIELYQRYPEYFESYHVETLKETAKVLMKNQSGHPRVLDTKHYKYLAWKAAMMLDEVWYAVNNHTLSRQAQRDTRNNFEKLFDK